MKKQDDKLANTKKNKSMSTRRLTTKFSKQSLVMSPVNLNLKKVHDTMEAKAISSPVSIIQDGESPNVGTRTLANGENS